MKAVKVFIVSKKGMVISIPFKPVEFYELTEQSLPTDSLVLGDDGIYVTPSGVIATKNNAWSLSSNQFKIWYELTTGGKA